MNLGPEIGRALAKMGYKTPTPIQANTIPAGLSGRDIIGQARTGTGKTAAFAVPIISSIKNRKPSYPKALVLAPTRELATQIKDETRAIGEFKKIRVVDIVGGRSIDRQARSLRQGVHVVVGTPGRILDMVQRGFLILDYIEIAVLDEADEMLNMGFLEDVEKILRIVPEDRQTFLFSATMEDKVMQIAFNHMQNPKIFRVKESEATLSNITEHFHMVKQSERLEILMDVLDREGSGQTLIFCKTKREVDMVTRRLGEYGYSADGIHGDYSQNKRDRVMTRFKSGRSDILVATDVAARGIHVDNITTVVNYRLPDDPTVYVHRIGRTGRAGKTGVAISLYGIEQKYYLSDYQNRLKASLDHK